jgi:hypothetical protein
LSQQYAAAIKGNDECVNLLLSDQRVEVNKANADGATPLYIAATLGNDECVALLLADRRVEVNKINASRETPLYTAARFGKDNCVRLLLGDQRVDVNLADADGATPLYIAANLTNQSLQCFDRILACNRTTPVALAATAKKLQRMYTTGDPAIWGSIRKRAADAIAAHTAHKPAWCTHCFTMPVMSTRLLKCSQCKQVGYCGKVCQIADWKAGHKTSCNKPTPATNASSSGGGGGGGAKNHKSEGKGKTKQ